MTQPSRWRAASLGLVTVGMTVIFLCFLLEAATRVAADPGLTFDLEMWKYARTLKQRATNPLIGHEHKPRGRAFLMGVDVEINEAGHRDQSTSVARQPGVGRIVMLGDSITFGWGVRAEDVAATRLEAMFQRTGNPVEVINAGVGNYNTVQEVEAFMAKDAANSPDLAILNYYVNDAEPVPSYRERGFLARHSQAWVFLTGRFDALWRMSGKRPKWDQYYLDLYETGGWAAAKDAMHRLAEFCRQRRVKLMIVSWPELHGVHDYRLQRITDLVRAVAEAEGVVFVDLLEALDDQDSSKLWVTVPDPHPNAFANALAAEYLFPFVQAEMVKPAR